MKLSKRKQRPVHRGNMLLQAGIVLAIVLYLAPGSFDRYADFQQQKVWTGTASHLSFVSQAGKRYIRDNRDALLTQVAGAPVVVTGAALKSAGYLPSGFSLTNDSGQTYQLAVAKDPVQAGQLVAFVLTTGGSEIPYKGLRQIASEADGMGGYVWPANTATGADGGWQANLGSYGLSGQQGHLAAFLSADVLGTDADGSDRLYRYQVNGKPDLNRMHTAIDMNGNNINSAGTVNAATGTFTGQVSAGTNISAGANITAGGSITSNNAITANNDIRSNNGWVITRGNKGWMNETYGGGFYMDSSDSVKVVNNKNIYTGGQVRAGSLRSDGDVSVAGQVELGKVAEAGTTCTVNGAVARKQSGAILSCQDGIWAGADTGTLVQLGEFRTKSTSGVTQQLDGVHKLCMVSGLMSAGDNGTCRVYPQSDGSSTWFLNMVGYNGTSTQTCWVSCLD